MEKKIYKKPEVEVLPFNVKDSVLDKASWGVDKNKEGDVKEGPEEGGVELDSRKNESGWDFEW